MWSMTATRLTGTALALGGLLGFAVPFFRPGALIVEPLDRGATLLERVQVLAENAALTHTSTLLGALGLALLVFGLFGVRRAVGRGTVTYGLVTFGVFLLAFGAIGLAIANGLNHMIAHIINHGGDRGSDTRTLFTIAVTVQAVKAGIIIIAGYGYLLGFAFIAAGLWRHFTAGIHAALALLLFVISIAALVALVIGDHFHDLAGTFYSLAEYAVLPLSLWALILGVAMHQGHPALTQESEG